MRVELDVLGEDKAAARYRQVGENIVRAQPAFHRIFRWILRRSRAEWAASAWAPLAEETRKRKARDGLPPGILRASGALERALTVPGARGQVLVIGDDEVAFGLRRGRGDAFHGRFHTFGRGVPRRPLLQIDGPEFGRVVRDELRDHLERAFT